MMPATRFTAPSWMLCRRSPFCPAMASTLFPVAGIIGCVPCWMGLVSPWNLDFQNKAVRIRHAAQRFTFVFMEIFLLLPPIVIPGSRWNGFLDILPFQRATMNQAGFLCCISSVWLEHPAHNRTYIGSNPLCSTKIAAQHLSDSRMKQLQWFL